MGWWEQVLAGAGFLGIGLYQAFSLVKNHRKSGGKRLQSEFTVGKLTVKLVDVYAVACVATLHIIANLLPVYKLHTDGYSPGAAIRLERTAVAWVFLVYALIVLITEGTNFLPLPQAILQLMAIGAFVEEFLLFHFAGPSSGLEGQYHSLLLVPIGVCIASTVLEMVHPKALGPPLVRSLALVLQGTWFFQIATSLFSSWISLGCELDERREGDYTVTCNGMSNMHRARAIATLQFNLHLAALLIFSLPAFSLLSKVYSSPRHYERLGEHEVPDEARELFELKDSSRTSFHQATYVLEDEEEQEVQEEEVLSKNSPDGNGFHRVSI